MSPNSPTVHVIMACHNRRSLTVRAVRGVAASAAGAGARMTITVFDDGSNDGTAEALYKLGLRIDVIRGDGSAFWARGMATAEARVLARSDVRDNDVVLWINDDVDLDIGAIRAMRDSLEVVPRAVLVGAMKDPSTAEITYSGMDRAGVHPLRFEMVPPTTALRPVDTFNGNFVAVPVQVARLLGGIDGTFAHALADIDYGLRCGRLNVPVLLLPGSHGACPRNPPPPPESILKAWKRFTSVKGGGHLDSMQRFIRKTGRHTWPVWVILTYAKWWLRNLCLGCRLSLTRF